MSNKSYMRPFLTLIYRETFKIDTISNHILNQDLLKYTKNLFSIKFFVRIFFNKCII